MADDRKTPRKQPTDPGKTPGSAEGGVLDGSALEDQAGKTPGAAEGAGQPSPVQGTKIDRQAGDPPA